MRPKLLEIEGLQSFTDTQTINFEELGETGLFGIFGPTGSGKSTILDAITLALYGKVKRADNGTQGIINTNRNTARVSFVFDLHRDGKKRTYKVERTYQRKKNSHNSCEAKIARLIEISESGEIPLCDKATEVTGRIKELLGLNSDDFTRAVVLPQNSFHEFLFLNNSERRSMLERIFYLEEYGKKLEEKLSRKLSKVKSRLDVLTGELKGYADASDEMLKEAEKAVESAFLERAKAEAELMELETKYQEAKEVWELVRELDDLRIKEERHLASGREIEKMRIRLEKAVKARELADMIKKNRELCDRLKETGEQLKEVVGVIPGLEAGLAESRAAYENMKKEASLEQPRLMERKTRLSDALTVKAEIDSLSSRIADTAGSINRLKNVMAEKDELIKEKDSEFGKLGEILDRLRQEAALLKVDPEYRQRVQEGAKLGDEVAARVERLKELEDKEKSLTETAAGLESRLKGVLAEIEETKKEQGRLAFEKQQHEASKPGDKDSLIKVANTIRTIQGKCQVLKLMKRELERAKANYDAIREEIANADRNAALKDKAVEEASSAYENCKLELEGILRKITSNAALILARGLQEGMPCPVCGSTHHPRPAAGTEERDVPELEKSAEEARKRLADTEAALKSAEREAIAAREQKKALSERLEQAARDVEQKAASYEKEKESLPEKLKGLEPEEIEARLEKAEKEYNEKLLSVEKWEAVQEELREREKQLNEKAAHQMMEEKGIFSELKIVRENLDHARMAVAEARSAADESRRRYEAFLSKYGISDAAAEIRRIAENDSRLHLLQKELDKTAEMLEIKRAELDRLKEEKRFLNAEMIKLEAQINGLSGQRQEKEAKLKELAGDVGMEDIEKEIRLIEEKIEAYENNENDLRTKMELMENRYNELKTKKTLLENQLKIYSDNMKADEERLSAAIEEKGFGSREEVEGSIMPEDEQKEIKALIDEYDRVAINLRAQRELLQKKLNSRSITEEEWEMISRSFRELSAYREECVTRSEVAVNNYNYIKKKHEKWIELQKSYSELDHKRGLYEQIQKLLRAEHGKDNSFIDYVAEERLRYVAAQASETLGIMTRHRYVLELDAESGFIIRDQANGGVHRVVKSLSGGETFLTSLSLALALSEQLQFKGQSPLEFFFLDEGFGTLDQDLLDTVMDSLERLCCKQRVIGLISHVPELKSRIGRRLIVVPPGFNGEGSRVYIEKA